MVDATDGLALVTSAEGAAISDIREFEELETVPCLDPVVLPQRGTASRLTPIAVVGAEVDPVERRGQVLVAAGAHRQRRVGP